MSYLEEKLLEALGRSQVIGGTGFDYGDWTPNDVRGIHVYPDGILIEKHVGKMKLTAINPQQAYSEAQKVALSNREHRSPLREIFRSKSFKNLEEITFFWAYVQHPHSKKFLYPGLQFDIEQINNGGRFRLFGLTVKVPAREAYERAQEGRKQGYIKPTLSELIRINLMPVVNNQGDKYLESIGLTPQTYKSDLQGGPLDRHLRSLSGTFRNHSKVIDRHRAMMTVDQHNAEHILSLGNDLDFADVDPEPILSLFDDVLVPSGMVPEYGNVFLDKAVVPRFKVFEGSDDESVERYLSRKQEGYVFRERVFSTIKNRIVESLLAKVRSTASEYREGLDRETYAVLSHNLSEGDLIGAAETLGGISERYHRPSPYAKLFSAYMHVIKVFKFEATREPVGTEEGELEDFDDTILPSSTKKPGDTYRDGDSALDVFVTPDTADLVVKLIRTLRRWSEESVSDAADLPYNLMNVFNDFNTGVRGLKKWLEDSNFPVEYISELDRYGYFRTGEESVELSEATDKRVFCMLYPGYYLYIMAFHVHPYLREDVWGSVNESMEARWRAAIHAARIMAKYQMGKNDDE